MANPVIVPAFAPDLNTIYTLDTFESWPKVNHIFQERTDWAIRAALHSGRPLLIRGEPGTGKSQLARAAAHILGGAFLYQVINSQCEPEDLLYRFDSVARLAQAQVAGAVGGAASTSLAPEQYLVPGILWWAFDPDSATKQAGVANKHFGSAWVVEGHTTFTKADRSKPTVVLIDEIDKADTDVPNSLLEALGNGGFLPPFVGAAVRIPDDTPRPLVILTTNEERELPPAFLRRCLVLHLSLPTEQQALRTHLRRHARAHFSEREITGAVVDKAFEQLWMDRRPLVEADLPAPGQAEFFDILRALVSLHPGDAQRQEEALTEIRDFALRKNRMEDNRP